jgi:hypothetical protein
VSDANRTVARVRAAQNALKDPAGGAGDKLAKVNEIAAHPHHAADPLQQARAGHAHYVSLHLTNAADQQVGRDAIERYEVLRKQLDAYIAELNKILGTEK